jgi:hypothetical protein
MWKKSESAIVFMRDGDSPDEGVTVKAGASTIKPEAMIIGGNWRMNVDKGQQENGGEDYRRCGVHGSVRRTSAVGVEAAIQRTAVS